MSASARKPKLIAASLLLAVLLLVGGYLRLKNLENSPRWFRDEGTYWAVAHSMAHSETPRVGPLEVTYVSPYMTHPPLSFLLGSLWLRWGPAGEGLKGYRQFNALLGVVSLALMFWLGCCVGGLRLAVLAALLGTLETTNLQFHRMGFPYNLYQVEALAVFLLVVFYLDDPRTKRLLPAVVVASFAAITVYYAVALWFVVGLAIISERRWRQIPALALLPLPLVILLAASATAHGEGFWMDLARFREKSGAGDLATTLRHWKEFFALSWLVGNAPMFPPPWCIIGPMPRPSGSAIAMFITTRAILNLSGPKTCQGG